MLREIKVAGWLQQSSARAGAETRIRTHPALLRGSPQDWLRAESAPSGFEGNLAEALGTFLGSRIGRWTLFAHPGDQPVDRDHDKEIYGASN